MALVVAQPFVGLPRPPPHPGPHHVLPVLSRLLRSPETEQTLIGQQSRPVPLLALIGSGRLGSAGLRLGSVHAKCMGNVKGVSREGGQASAWPSAGRTGSYSISPSV